MTDLHLVLASASPRRSFLLSQLGFSFRTEPTHVAEHLPGHIPVTEAAAWLSRLKAESHPSARTNDCIILAADTVVILENRLLGKPENAADAAAMLRQLSGKHHSVITAATVVMSGNSETFQEETKVQFKSLDEFTIAQYVASGLPMDKAGSYGVQDGLAPDQRTGTSEETAVLLSAGCPDLIRECGLTEVVHPLIDRLEGPFFNVMGLPVATLYRRLKKLGL